MLFVAVHPRRIGGPACGLPLPIPLHTRAWSLAFAQLHRARRGVTALLATAVLAGVLPQCVRAQQTADADDEGALDAQLAELLGEAAQTPPADEEAIPQHAPAGEDIGAAGNPQDDPLSKIGQRMREAAQLLVTRDTTGRASAAQKDVLRDLDALIAQQRRRTPSTTQRKDGSQQAERSQVQQPSQRNPNARPRPNQGPAQDASSQVGSEAPAHVDAKPLHGLLEQLWGHLPRRAREQMQQIQSDAFLPEFEVEIERYFRRLAEDPKFQERRRARNN